MYIEYLSSLEGIDWPTIPLQSAATKLAVQYQLEQTQWWSGDELLKAQFRQVRDLVKFARSTVPFYQQTLPAGLDGDGLTPESWYELPILPRSTLREAGTRLISNATPAMHGRQYPVRTSGSTGVPVEVRATDLTQIFWRVFTLREHLWHRRKLSGKLMAIRFTRMDGTTAPDCLRTAGWGVATDDIMRTGPGIMVDILSDVSALATMLERENPEYLLSHPSELLELARYCDAHGIRPSHLREVRSMGEMLPDNLREECLAAWGVPLVDMYTCQEAGYLALQCPGNASYHVQSENVLLEVLDEEGKPCGPGEIGRVVITSLHNYATPLIRYELGDYAEVGEECACGRGLPVLRRILGRHRNLLTLPDGSKRWPILGYENGLQEIAPVETLQMIQHNLEEIEVRMVMPRTLTEAEREQLTSFIHDNLGYAYKLEFTRVESIRNERNGKIEQFISML